MTQLAISESLWGLIRAPICLGRQKWGWHTHKYQSKTYDFLLYTQLIYISYIYMYISDSLLPRSFVLHFICGTCLGSPMRRILWMRPLVVDLDSYSYSIWFLGMGIAIWIVLQNLSVNCRLSFWLLVQLWGLIDAVIVVNQSTLWHLWQLK